MTPRPVARSAAVGGGGYVHVQKCRVFGGVENGDDREDGVCIMAGAYFLCHAVDPASPLYDATAPNNLSFKVAMGGKVIFTPPCIFH